jgi:hypothetical protein
MLLDEMRQNHRARMHASGVLKHQSVEDGSFEKGKHPVGCICHTVSKGLGSYERLVDWIGLDWISSNWLVSWLLVECIG